MLLGRNEAVEGLISLRRRVLQIMRLGRKRMLNASKESREVKYKNVDTRTTDPAFLADETAQDVFIGITGENSLLVDYTSVKDKSTHFRH
jgi:hypothetical protein